MRPCASPALAAFMYPHTLTGNFALVLNSGVASAVQTALDISDQNKAVSTT